MISTGDFAAEKAELDAVLASGIFERSPSLAHILTYVCSRYFDGAAGDIKEYNIAVEALGRPPGFDQKRDSIVRVQFHRLRDRLTEYYGAEGAAHPVQIVIPQGQYIPQFLKSEPAPAKAESEAEPIAPAEVPPPPRLPQPGQNKWLVRNIVLVAAVAIAAASATWAILGRAPAPAPVRPPAVPAAAAVGQGVVRILAGLEEGSFSDGFGNVWLSDRFFEGGAVVKTLGHPIAGTREPRLYQTRRQGAFRYDIPLEPGDYELRLHFAETNFGEDNPAGYGGEGSRAFAVLINDSKVIDRLDVIGEAGASVADIKVFRDVHPAGDGKLHLTFTPIVSAPFLNAIEITPGTPGRMNPIRIVAQPRAYTDAAGLVWLPDRFAVGGQMVKRTSAVANASDQGLFGGERFGNLAYTIPVAPGRYTLSLYMSERWLGPDLPARGGAGSRVFDIYCNGVALARDFDIFARSGGSNRALVQTFRGLRPNHQGKLAISLVPFKNFPAINALEIVDEGR